MTSDAKPKTRHTCSLKCRMVFVSKSRMKCPDDKTLRLLYAQRKLSTVEIAAMYNTDPTTVYKACVKAGLVMRKHTATRVCQFDGCNDPPQKLLHPLNGSMYGTLCKIHRKNHRRQLSKDYWEREGRVITVQRANIRGASSSKVLNGIDIGELFDINIHE